MNAEHPSAVCRRLPTGTALGGSKFGGGEICVLGRRPYSPEIWWALAALLSPNFRAVVEGLGC